MEDERWPIAADLDVGALTLVPHFASLSLHESAHDLSRTPGST